MKEAVTIYQLLATIGFVTTTTTKESPFYLLRNDPRYGLWFDANTTDIPLYSMLMQLANAGQRLHGTHQPNSWSDQHVSENVTQFVCVRAPTFWSVLTIGTLLTLILPYGIIFLLSIVGNLLVIITLTLNRSMRSVTNIFLLNLAISDLLLGVFCMPFTLVGVLLRRFIFGAFFCHLLSYLQGMQLCFV